MLQPPLKGYKDTSFGREGELEWKLSNDATGRGHIMQFVYVGMHSPSSLKIKLRFSVFILIHFLNLFFKRVSVVADTDPVRYWIGETSDAIQIGNVKDLLLPTPSPLLTVVRLR